MCRRFLDKRTQLNDVYFESISKIDDNLVADVYFGSISKKRYYDDDDKMSLPKADAFNIQ